MTAARRPSWLFRIIVACAAAMCVLLVGGSIADRPLGPMAANHDATRDGATFDDATHDGASARPVSSTRAAWQRSGGRRSHRTTSSQFSSGVRTQGMVLFAAPHRRRGVTATADARMVGRDGRLRSAPTRAPPHHR